MAPVTYQSKTDTWLAAVILASACACPGACVAILGDGFPVGPVMLWVGFLVVGGVCLPIWILRATIHELRDNHLFVRCGPFRWTVPFADIASVRRTRSIMSDPALSYERVKIRYGRRRSILISPERRAEFPIDLENRRKRSGGCK